MQVGGRQAIAGYEREVMEKEKEAGVDSSDIK